MKTTLAILGIFAAAVLAASFVSASYAITQGNSQGQTGSQSNSVSSGGNAIVAGFVNTGNANIQAQKTTQLGINWGSCVQLC